MKHLIKISIGTIAFVVFCAVGVPMFNAQMTTSKEKKKKGLINKGNSRFYTKDGYKIPSSCQKQRVPGVIYLGEPTEGLLD